MGGLTFLSISMYCLNNETRSTFVTRQVPSIVFIYISNPTFPLFKNRFSDNLRLFKRQIVPIRIRNRFDFSTGSLCLSVYGWRTISRSWSIRPQCVAQCASHPLAGVLARLFFPSPSSLSSLLRSLISVIEHRTRTRSQCSARSVHIRNGTRVVSLYTRFYTLPSFVLCSPLSSRLSRCMQILSTNLLSARASVLGGR